MAKIYVEILFGSIFKREKIRFYFSKFNAISAEKKQTRFIMLFSPQIGKTYPSKPFYKAEFVLEVKTK